MREVVQVMTTNINGSTAHVLLAHLGQHSVVHEHKYHAGNGIRLNNGSKTKGSKAMRMSVGLGAQGIHGAADVLFFSDIIILGVLVPAAREAGCSSLLVFYLIAFGRPHSDNADVARQSLSQDKHCQGCQHAERCSKHSYVIQVAVVQLHHLVVHPAIVVCHCSHSS